MQKEVISKLPQEVILAADVGGTNTNIALCSAEKSVKIHVKYHFDTQTTSFESVVKKVLSDSKVKIKAACIAVAGPIAPDKKSVKLTNAKWRINVRKLPFKAKLINDFEALGYAINILSPKDVKTIRKGKASNEPIGLIGAGTGLGKALLVHNGKYYEPLASEGGHADLPIRTKEEFIFASLLNKKRKTVEYEDVLSGRGLLNIYQFLRKEYDGPKISDSREITKGKSPAAKEAMKWFAAFYGRCAKNFALDGLTRGGIYIGGGIAAEHPEIFGKVFVNEFMRNESQKDVLKKIPIKVITNYDLSLLGAGFAATR